MDISKLTISPQLTIKPTVISVLKNLQPGQQLQANVLTDTANNLVKLKIGTTEFIARTQVALRADQKITLDVVKAGNMPELRLVREAEVRNFQADVLRSILPKQLPMQRLYANLQAVYSNILRSLPQPGADPKLQQPANPLQLQQSSTTPGQIHAGTTVDKEMLQLIQNLSGKGGTQAALADKVGPNLIQTARSILAAVIPNSGNITPAQLRQAILGYGLFMEAQLAAGQPPGTSFKGDLLQLLFQIGNLLQLNKQQLPTQQPSPQTNTSQIDTGFIKLLEILFRHAEGSLARVHLNQLASLPADEGSRQVWQFEVPVKHQDHVNSFLIRLEQEQTKNRGDDANPIWYVTLTFNIEPLGPVKAKISMHNDEVSTLFLAEKPESAELLNKRMAELSKAFTESGLSVGKLIASHGDAQPEKPQQTITTSLLDEKA